MGYLLFKIVTAVFILIPIVIGLRGLIKGFKEFPGSETFSQNQILFIDSEWRFHSFITFGIGIIIACMLPYIQNPLYGFCFNVLMGIVSFAGIREVNLMGSVF
jgi:hypothetical protein